MKKINKITCFYIIIFIIAILIKYSLVAIVNPDFIIREIIKDLKTYPFIIIGIIFLYFLYIKIGDFFLFEEQSFIAEKYYKIFFFLFKKDITYIGQGMSDFKKGKYDDSVDCFKKAININPNNKEAYLCLSIVYASIKEHNMAIKNAEKVIELDPEMNDAYFLLGISYLQIGEDDLAVKNLENTLHINPKHAGAYYNLGFLFKKKNLISKAEEYFLKARELDPIIDSKYTLI